MLLFSRRLLWLATALHHIARPPSPLLSRPQPPPHQPIAKMVRRFLVVLLACCLAATSTLAAKEEDPKECEVCIQVLEAVMSKLDDKQKKNSDVVESAIGKYCEQDSLNPHQHKLCYLVDPIKRKVSTPITFGMTAAEVCKRKLKKESADICSVKYPVKVDDNTDYSKMRIKHLKQLLADRGVTCPNCIEKEEFVKRAQETKHMDL